MVEARVLLDFAIQLCEDQLEAARDFSLEHPGYAKSWEESSVKKLSEKEGVFRFCCDQYQFGQKSPGNHKHYKKRICILTNNVILEGFLGKTCTGLQRLDR